MPSTEKRAVLFLQAKGPNRVSGTRQSVECTPLPLLSKHHYSSAFLSADLWAFICGAFQIRAI
jgi:hypothetical protein